jgi:hypothetical protein
MSGFTKYMSLANELKASVDAETLTALAVVTNLSNDERRSLRAHLDGLKRPAPEEIDAKMEKAAKPSKKATRKASA